VNPVGDERTALLMALREFVERSEERAANDWIRADMRESARRFGRAAAQLLEKLDEPTDIT
jgi:hypothetical protein